MKRWVELMPLILMGLILGFQLLVQGGIGPRSVASASELEQKSWEEVHEQWQGSTHAQVEVNCSSCHLDQETKAFVATPTYASCRECHEFETDTFLLGKHGIRLLEGLPSLMPKMARLPMQANALDQVMSCNTCHDVHALNTTVASVNACLTCHQDQHSLNYLDSPHGIEFVAQQDQIRPPADVVSCATCHLPRSETGRGDQYQVHVNHNNTYTLKPQDRMVKDVCMSCHGMEFAYQSIFDPALVEANFSHPPEHDLETLEMIRVQLETLGSGAS